jgi:hypothetical protein
LQIAPRRVNACQQTDEHRCRDQPRQGAQVVQTKDFVRHVVEQRDDDLENRQRYDHCYRGDDKAFDEELNQ